MGQERLKKEQGDVMNLKHQNGQDKNFFYVSLRRNVISGDLEPVSVSLAGTTRSADSQDMVRLSFESSDVHFNSCVRISIEQARSLAVILGEIADSMTRRRQELAIEEHLKQNPPPANDIRTAVDANGSPVEPETYAEGDVMKNGEIAAEGDTDETGAADSKGATNGS